VALLAIAEMGQQEVSGFIGKLTGSFPGVVCLFVCFFADCTLTQKVPVNNGVLGTAASCLLVSS